MASFSLNISAHTVRDAHLLVELAADLIETRSVKPGDSRMLRVDISGDNKSSVAILTVYSKQADGF